MEGAMSAGRGILKIPQVMMLRHIRAQRFGTMAKVTSAQLALMMSFQADLYQSTNWCAD
jgi:hypothetical protein